MLDQIVAHKKEQLRAMTGRMEIKWLERLIANMPPAISLEKSLNSQGDISIIAEIKRRSPSKGILNADLNAGETAGQYELAGASAISVLTESRYFNGSIDDLKDVKKRVALPVLRKDFIINEYQVLESRAIGADAILLIVRILSKPEITQLCNLARQCGLGVLIEIHDAKELETALNQKTNLIGINNRNLENFKTDISCFRGIADLVPNEKMVVAESGIQTHDDILRLKDWGADAALVGEAIITSNNPFAKICELRGNL